MPPARLLNWPRLVALVQDRWQAGRPPPPAATPEPTPAPPAGGVPPPAVPVPTPEETAAAALQAACRATGVQPLRVYTQVYDEASRNEATTLRQALQQAGGEVLQLTPIENVTRSASLRQQRRPVPWPQPTLVVHQRSDLNCARLLAEHVRQHWGPGNGGEVWVRELPSSLRTSSGSQRVIELWLPPSTGGERSAGGR